MSSIFTWFVQQSRNQSHHSGSHLIYEQLARVRHCTAITGAMKKTSKKTTTTTAKYHYLVLQRGFFLAEEEGCFARAVAMQCKGQEFISSSIDNPNRTGDQTHSPQCVRWAF